MVPFILLTTFKKEPGVWFIETRKDNSNLLGNKRIASSKTNSKEVQDVCDIYASI